MTPKPGGKKMNFETMETMDSLKIQRSNSAKKGTTQNSLMTNTLKNYLISKHNNKKPADVKEFKIKVLLGKGSFGKVFLVQRDNKVFAMKTIRKDLLLEKTLIDHCLLEKEVLMKVDHPFMVNMEYVFQTDNRIFFIMEFVRGGELYRHLRAEKQFSEKRAKFYSMQVALAIGHLHERNIVYRDLKPENILMDSDGYIKLTDFGLSKNLE